VRKKVLQYNTDHFLEVLILLKEGIRPFLFKEGNFGRALTEEILPQLDK
jgi:hypothetical protein